jgi:hypothetical protein
VAATGASAVSGRWRSAPELPVAAGGRLVAVRLDVAEAALAPGHDRAVAVPTAGARHAAEVALDHPLDHADEVAAHEVDAAEGLGVEGEVDERADRGAVGDGVEADHREVGVHVVAGEARRAAVERDRRAEDVALDAGERADGGADDGGLERGVGLGDAPGDLLRGVLEHPEVEGVREDPHPPGGGDVVRGGVVVRRAEDDRVRAEALDGEIRVEGVRTGDEVEDAARELVLLEVELGLHVRGLRPVGTADDEGLRERPRLQPVGRHHLRRVVERVEAVLGHRVAGAAELSLAGSGVPGHVDARRTGAEDAGARRRRVVGGLRADGRGDDEAEEQGEGGGCGDCTAHAVLVRPLGAPGLLDGTRNPS